MLKHNTWCTVEGCPKEWKGWSRNKVLRPGPRTQQKVKDERDLDSLLKFIEGDNQPDQKKTKRVKKKANIVASEEIKDPVSNREIRSVISSNLVSLLKLVDTKTKYRKFSIHYHDKNKAEVFKCKGRSCAIPQCKHFPLILKHFSHCGFTGHTCLLQCFLTCPLCKPVTSDKSFWCNKVSRPEVNKMEKKVQNKAFNKGCAKCNYKAETEDDLKSHMDSICTTTKSIALFTESDFKKGAESRILIVNEVKLQGIKEPQPKDKQKSEIKEEIQEKVRAKNEETLKRQEEDEIKEKEYERLKVILKEKENALHKMKRSTEAAIQAKGREMTKFILEFEKVEDDKMKDLAEIDDIDSKILYLQRSKNKLLQRCDEKKEIMDKLSTKKKDIERVISSLIYKTKHELSFLETEVKSLKDKLPQPEKKPASPKPQSISLLAFINRKISSKEGELECPVCLEEASSPIFMCSQLHLVCSSCRPQLTQCPECRQQYRGQPRRHRYTPSKCHQYHQQPSCNMFL